MDSYTITPVRVIQVAANNKLTQLSTIDFGQSGLRTNRLACDVRVGQH